MKKATSVLLSLVMACSVIPGEVKTQVVTDLPEEAFELLTQSASDPCSVCAKKAREKAFQVLDDRFKPGRILKSNNLCQFMRTEACGENELVLTCYPTPLPLLTFKFHTAEKHMVGISVADFTEKQFASLYDMASAGTILEGALELVEYKYGDGPAYNYYPVRNHVQVHCRILDIRQAERD